jgi:hypothetical protein
MHPSLNPKRHDAYFDDVLAVKIISLIIIWALAVLNTELLIKWNRPTGAMDSWQFGQVRSILL